MTLVEFLLARIAEDEQQAQKMHKRATEHHATVRRVENLGRFMPGWYEWPEVAATAFRVLAECDAKRRIVEEAGRLSGLDLELPRDMQFMGARQALNAACRFLALPFADHPDYRQEWKP